MDVLHFPLATCKFSDVSITGLACSKTDCRDLSLFHGHLCIILEFWSHTTLNSIILKDLFLKALLSETGKSNFLADILVLMVPIIGFWIKISIGKPTQAGHVVMCLACQKPCFFLKRRCLLELENFFFFKGKGSPFRIK